MSYFITIFTEIPGVEKFFVFATKLCVLGRPYMKHQIEVQRKLRNLVEIFWKNVD